LGRSHLLHALLPGRARTPWEWHEALIRNVVASAAGRPQLAPSIRPRSICSSASRTGVQEYILRDLCRSAKLDPLVAATGKPMIISTGHGELDEIGEAVDRGHATAVPPVRGDCALHFPALPSTPVREPNLKRIGRPCECFDCPIRPVPTIPRLLIVSVARAMRMPHRLKHIRCPAPTEVPDAEFSSRTRRSLA